MTGDDYEQLAYRESQGKYSVGVRVLAAVGREFTEDERRLAWRFEYEFVRLALRETARQDPEDVRKGEDERARLLACFGDQPIYVESIPNEYCSDYCCVNRPWLRVTTRRGRIVLGWRKRVIEIRWNESDIRADGTILFYGEDVTKSDRMIHAWGYDKAQEYLLKLLLS